MVAKRLRNSILCIVRNDGPLISEIQWEQFRPREDEARQLLKKVVLLVKPVMKRRRLKVGILAEFWPEEWDLLGQNFSKGQSILLRLRDFRNEREFIPLEMIVDTMLHELSHNYQSQLDHDDSFYALWNQLRAESKLPFLKGYTSRQIYLAHSYGPGPTHD